MLILGGYWGNFWAIFCNIRMIFRQFLGGIWELFGWYLCNILVIFWYILVVFWSYLGYIWAQFWWYLGDSLDILVWYLMLPKYCPNIAQISQNIFQILSKYHQHIVQILFRNWPTIDQNIVYILSKYCIDNAHLFPKYCSIIFQIVTKHCLILSIYCQNIDQNIVYSEYCVDKVDIFPQNIVQMFPKCYPK